MKRTIVETIAAKRDGQKLAADEIKHLIAELTLDPKNPRAVEQYQMTAFLMAVFFRGLDDEETVALTARDAPFGDRRRPLVGLRRQSRQAFDRRRRRQGVDLPRPARRRVRRSPCRW